MRRTTVRLLIIGAICLFVGIASGAAAMALVPNPGTPPSIYDDFAWSSTADSAASWRTCARSMASTDSCAR